MKYVVQVVVVFATEEAGAKYYDVWENTLILNSEGPRNALEGGIRMSKKLLNNTSNWSTLGYSEKPVLYAVRSVHTADDLPKEMVNYAHDSITLTRVAIVGESEFEAIKSFETISIPFGVMYIDR